MGGMPPVQFSWVAIWSSYSRQESSGFFGSCSIDMHTMPPSSPNEVEGSYIFKLRSPLSERTCLLTVALAVNNGPRAIVFAGSTETWADASTLAVAG